MALEKLVRHTYYQLFRMLTEDVAVRSLSCRRHGGFERQRRAALGRQVDHRCRADGFKML